MRSRLGDAVVAQHPGQPGLEAFRQRRPARRRGSAGSCGSTRAGCAPGCPARPRLAAGPVAAQLGQVGEHREQVQLARRPAGRRARRGRPGSPTAAALARRVDVEAEQQAAQVVQCRARPARPRTGRRGLGRQVHLDRRGRGGAAAGGVRRRPGSSRSSGAPVSTWLPTDTRHSRTRARNGARSTVSIFMLSSTRIGAPASTSSPAASGVATTSAGRASALAPGGIAFSGTGPTITVSVNPSATTTYTIATLTDGTCTAQAADMSGSAVVTVNPRPTAVLSGSGTICNGQSATLSLAVTGSGTISGTLAPGGIAFSGTGPTITVSVNPSATTTYTIATLADGTCTAQARDMSGSAVVTVNPRPTAVLSGSGTICNGQSATLSLAVTGSGTISGTLAPGGIAFSGTGPTITVSVNPSATTTYTIATLTDGTCTAQAADMSGSAVVTVNPRPTAVLSGSGTICNGQSATLSLAVTGSGTISGTLAPGGMAFSGTGPTITVSVNPSATTTYTIATLTDGTCTAQAADMSGSAVVTVNPRPTAVLSGSGTICNGQSATFSLAVTGSGTISGTLAPGGIAFSGTGPTITVLVNPSATTTYTIATLADGSCAAQGVDMTRERGGDGEPEADRGVERERTTICNGQSATLSLAVTGSGTISGTLAPGGIAFSGDRPDDHGVGRPERDHDLYDCDLSRWDLHGSSGGYERERGGDGEPEANRGVERERNDLQRAKCDVEFGGDGERNDQRDAGPWRDRL